MMTDDRNSSKKWPQCGFEQFFDYVSNFVHLNINLGSQEACRRYHDDWVGRYRSAIGSWTDYDVAIWSVRCRQSLKLSFSATYFALSAEEARKYNVLASAYYLAYYSILHAMWAVLFVHPDQSVNSITDITHQKVANVFHSSFAGGNGHIIQADAKGLAEDLRFLREYYSYRMPLNSPFEEVIDISNAHIHLGGFVKQSIQLANLHSHLVLKAAKRLGRVSACVPNTHRDAFKEAFFRINGKEHHSRGLRLLDPADLQAQGEYLAIGCDLLPLSIAYDHMFDDFMTYANGRRPTGPIIKKTRTLVFNALF